MDAETVSLSEEVAAVNHTEAYLATWEEEEREVKGGEGGMGGENEVCCAVRRDPDSVAYCHRKDRHHNSDHNFTDPMQIFHNRNLLKLP